MTNFLPPPDNLYDKSSLVESYFWNGFWYSEITDIVYNLHNTTMSLRSWHRILRARGLLRRWKSINIQGIMTEIMNEWV